MISSRFEALYGLSLTQFGLALLVLLASTLASSLLISLYIHKPLGLALKRTLTSRIFPLSFLFSCMHALLALYLYGLSPYALFVFAILSLLFVLAYIDSVLLAIPDALNFLCFFGVFVGLYCLDALGFDALISSLAACGGLCLVRVFGSFVFGKEILGEADLVVFASMGALLPLDALPLLIFLSCLLAMGYILLLSLLSIRDRQITLSGLKVPFVVFLSLGFELLLLYLAGDWGDWSV